MRDNRGYFYQVVKKLGAEDISYLAGRSSLFLYRGKIFWFKLATGRVPYKRRTFWFFLGKKKPKASKIADFLFLVLRDLNKALVIPMPLVEKKTMFTITDYDGNTSFDGFALELDKGFLNDRELDKSFLNDRLDFLIQKYDYEKNN